jgi:hypothetical protein
MAPRRFQAAGSVKEQPAKGLEGRFDRGPQRRKIISRSFGYYCIENKDQLQHEAELSTY